MRQLPQCEHCYGSGEHGTEHGLVDCPECGGAGFLPTRSVLVEWRSRDIERAMKAQQAAGSPDVAWLLAELRMARTALHEIIALAHDARDEDGIAMRIRFTANRALGLYEATKPPRAEDEARA